MYDAHAVGKADCGLGFDDRPILLSLFADGRVGINADRTDVTGLRSELPEIYKTRSRKVIYISYQHGAAPVSAVESILEDAEIEKACVLDPANPLKFPPAIPAG